MLQGSVNKVDGTNAASGLYTFNSKGSSFVHSIVSFLYSGVGAAAIPARLRLRKNFGERAFSPSAVLVSISFYIYLCSRVIWFLPEDENDSSDSFVQAIVVIVFLILPLNSFSLFLIKTFKLAYKHFKEIYSHSEDKNYKYSYYRGEPIFNNYSHKIGTKLFGYEVDEKIIRIYFEPKGFMVEHLKKVGFPLIGLVIVGVYIFGIYKGDFGWIIITSGLFCLWLVTYIFANLSLAFSGFCLLLEEVSIAMKIRDTVLDMVDGEYDMQFLMNQKEVFTNNEGKIDADKSLDIAENVFQNPENINLASFPTFEDNSIKKRENPVYHKSIETISEKEIQNLPAPVIEKEVEMEETKYVKISNKGKSKESTLGEKIGGWAIGLFIMLFIYSYLSNGLLPFSTYYPDLNATISPENANITLKSVEGGFNSTTLEFDIQNLGKDTLQFPFIEPNDARSIRIYAQTSRAKLFNDSSKRQLISLNEEQEFDGIIVVPPNENKTYKLTFSDFAFTSFKEFSIVSEDKALKKTFILFDNVRL